MAEEIINRVANSPLVSFDLEAYYPTGERVVYDLKDNLFQGLILREKDFRTFIKAHDWGQYAGKHVAIICSAEAIIPTWAYMLLASKLQAEAATVIVGDAEALETALFQQQFAQIDWASFQGKKVVLKGCSDKPVPQAVYVAATNRLLPYVASLMFGEPCSTVPVYKRPKAR